MDNLLSILDSFKPGWKEKKVVNDFLAILNEMVIPNYPVLGVKIEKHKAVFSKEWDQITAGFKDAHIFEQFVPRQYGGRKNLGVGHLLSHGTLGLRLSGYRHYFCVPWAGYRYRVPGQRSAKRSTICPEWPRDSSGPLP